jgi:hypothetical protein
VAYADDVFIMGKNIARCWRSICITGQTNKWNGIKKMKNTKFKIM